MHSSPIPQGPGSVSIAVDQRGIGLSDKPAGGYRAFDTTVAQNQERKGRRLAMPVLAIGGAASYGEHVAEATQLVADDVQSVVITGAGHWVAEEAPEAMLEALTAFLAAYRDGSAVADGTGTIASV